MNIKDEQDQIKAVFTPTSEGVVISSIKDGTVLPWDHVAELSSWLFTKAIDYGIKRHPERDQ